MSAHKKAFTLIELLVVISIIAILLAVATVSYTNSQEKGRDNRRKSDLKAIQQALELYFAQNGKYPAASASGQIQCNLTGDTNVRNWNTEFYCDPTGTPDPPKTTYMNPLPKDPVPTTTSTPQYYYDSSGTNSTYRIFAKLENLKDPDVGAITACNTSIPTNMTITGSLAYCGLNP